MLSIISVVVAIAIGSYILYLSFIKHREKWLEEYEEESLLIQATMSLLDYPDLMDNLMAEYLDNTNHMHENIYAFKRIYFKDFYPLHAKAKAIIKTELGGIAQKLLKKRRQYNA